MSLTPKRERFCDEYIVDLNGAAAARRAGYSEDSAAGIAWELLQGPEIQARIQELQADRQSRTKVTADRVVLELARVAFADLRSVVRWDEERAVFVPSEHISDDDAAAIGSIKAKTVTRADGTKAVHVEVSPVDKLGALRELGKHLGITPDRLDITTGGSALSIYLPTNQRDDEGLPKVGGGPGEADADDW